MNLRIAHGTLLLALLGTAAYAPNLPLDGARRHRELQRPAARRGRAVRVFRRAARPRGAGRAACARRRARPLPRLPSRRRAPTLAERSFGCRAARAAAEELRDRARALRSATRCRAGCSAPMPPASVSTSTTRRSPKPVPRQRRMSKTGAVERPAEDRTPRTTLIPPPRASAAADAAAPPRPIRGSTRSTFPTSARRAWCSRSC